MYCEEIFTNERVNFLAKEFRKQDIIQTFWEYLKKNRVLVYIKKGSYLVVLPLQPKPTIK